MLEVMTDWKDEGSGHRRKDEKSVELNAEIRANFCERWTQNFALKILNSLIARRFGCVTSINASLRWY